MQNDDLRIALYPGSFDPITKGHLDVLIRASKMFDKVIIAVLNNPNKKPFIKVGDRVGLIKQVVEDECLKNVLVDSFEGLTVDFAKMKGAKFLIRGLRAVSDFEYEMQLSQTNASIAPEIGTVFLTTRPKYNFISSSIIKELNLFGQDISKFVPECVIEYLHNRKESER